MVQVNWKTFEDLVGNVADDTKHALDQVLERDGGRASAKVAPPGAHASADDLATLPTQVAELTKVVSALLARLEDAGVVGTTPKAPGRKGATD